MSQIHGNGEVVIGKVQRNGQIQTWHKTGTELKPVYTEAVNHSIVLKMTEVWKKESLETSLQD